jgi:hypothetical protein
MAHQAKKRFTQEEDRTSERGAHTRRNPVPRDALRATAEVDASEAIAIVL